jgi:hypothetical protein
MFPRAGRMGQGFRLMTATQPVRINAIADHYRHQAEMCLRMAEHALSPYDEEWLRLAADWMKMARQAEASSQPT